MTDKTRSGSRTPEPRPLGVGAGINSGLMAFDSEESSDDAIDSGTPEAEAPQSPVARRSLRSWLSWSALAILAATATTSLVALGPTMRLPMPKEPSAATGRVTFETVPPGIEMVLDGQSRGQTPITMKVSAGHHEVVLRHGTDERVIPLELAAGAELIHRVEFAATPPAALSKLTVLTEPAGARVVVDGELRGVSPVTVQDLSAGRHRIAVSGGGVSADRTVTTEAGATTSVVFSLATAGPDTTAGWLVIDAPFEVQAIENGDVIGTSAAARIMVPPGSHEIDFVNPALGYQSRRRVDIGAARTATVKLEARAPVNINARPWAEVTVDGAAVGTTPLANMVLNLGNHRILFHHPTLGDQQQDVVVTLSGPNRFSAELMK